jgi:hypothetical protein
VNSLFSSAFRGQQSFRLEPALTLTCLKCSAPLIAAADLQTTDMLKCPVHGDIGTLSELLDQTLQRKMGNALTEALKKGDDDAS